MAKWAGGIKRDLYGSYIGALNDFAAQGETQSNIAFGTYIAHDIAWQNLKAFGDGFEQGMGDYPTYLKFNSARADLRYSVHAGCYAANLVKTVSGIVQVVGGVLLIIDGALNAVASPGTGPAMGMVVAVALDEVALGYVVTGSGALTLTQSIPAVLEEVGAMYSVHKVNADRMLGDEGGTKKDSSTRQPTSQNQMQEQVKKRRAPKEVDRVDKPHVDGQQPHVHFKDGTSLNQDGTVHDKHNGIANLSNKVKEWLLENGWGIND